MKKLVMTLGVAAVATLVGCKDPDYVSRNKVSSQDEVKNAGAAETVKPAAPVEVKVEPAAPVVETRHCTCPPGTKHAQPCACGADDCRCVVVTKPLPPPPAETMTVYIVQNGDYLSKISKRFNIRTDAIVKANPGLKPNRIRVGQKINIPGKVDVGAQPQPIVRKAGVKAPRKGYVAFTGATKEYVVKNGDSIGVIAYANGLSIRQLKELNKLTGDTLRVGQKLQIPAVKPVKTEVKKDVKKPVDVKAVDKKDTPTKKVDDGKKPDGEKKDVVVAPVTPVKPVVETKPDTPPADVKVDDAKPATGDKPAEPENKIVETQNYKVQEGDDMTSVSIEWGVSAAVIRDLNGMSITDQLKPGQVIKLPKDAVRQ